MVIQICISNNNKITPHKKKTQYIGNRSRPKKFTSGKKCRQDNNHKKCRRKPEKLEKVSFYNICQRLLVLVPLVKLKNKNKKVYNSDRTPGKKQPRTYSEIRIQPVTYKNGCR